MVMTATRGDRRSVSGDCCPHVCRHPGVEAGSRPREFVFFERVEEEGIVYLFTEQERRGESLLPPLLQLRSVTCSSISSRERRT